MAGQVYQWRMFLCDNATDEIGTWRRKIVVVVTDIGLMSGDLLIFIALQTIEFAMSYDRCG